MGEGDYENYDTQMTKVTEEVATLELDSWTQNLYWSWLYALQPVFESKGEEFPAFMQTDAWARKDLHTALSSWTELKHDTILYAKQVMAEIRVKVDGLIVSLHWGVEYAGEPTPLQRDQARQLANAGVDVLWGHHPHVLQPAEWVDSEDGNHRMLALYSLGNLLTDQTMTYETRHSALVQLQFQGGEISQLSFQPLVLTQKDARLGLIHPDEDALNQISNRLGWAELIASFP